MELPIPEEIFYEEVIPNLTLNDISRLGLEDILLQEIASRTNLEQEFLIAINEDNQDLVRLLLDAGIPIPELVWNTIPYRTLAVVGKSTH